MEPQAAHDAIGYALGYVTSGEQPEQVPGGHTGALGELVPGEGLVGPQSAEHALEGSRRQSEVGHGASFPSVAYGMGRGMGRAGRKKAWRSAPVGLTSSPR
jgi:hypothetical protein